MICLRRTAGLLLVALSIRAAGAAVTCSFLDGGPEGRRVFLDVAVSEVRAGLLVGEDSGRKEGWTRGWVDLPVGFLGPARSFGLLAVLRDPLAHGLATRIAIQPTALRVSPSVDMSPRSPMSVGVFPSARGPLGFFVTIPGLQDSGVRPRSLRFGSYACSGDRGMWEVEGAALIGSSGTGGPDHERLLHGAVGMRMGGKPLEVRISGGISAASHSLPGGWGRVRGEVTLPRLLVTAQLAARTPAYRAPDGTMIGRGARVGLGLCWRPIPGIEAVARGERHWEWGVRREIAPEEEGRETAPGVVPETAFVEVGIEAGLRRALEFSVGGRLKAVREIEGTGQTDVRLHADLDVRTRVALGGGHCSAGADVETTWRAGNPLGLQARWFAGAAVGPLAIEIRHLCGLGAGAAGLATRSVGAALTVTREGASLRFGLCARRPEPGARWTIESQGKLTVGSRGSLD